MSREDPVRRHRLQTRATLRALGGRAAAGRAEQLRALGVPAHVVADQLGVDFEAIITWYELQDALVYGAVPPPTEVPAGA